MGGEKRWKGKIWRGREASWAARHETLKQQHGCQGNFTAQWFHTSAVTLPTLNIQVHSASSFIWCQRPRTRKARHGSGARPKCLRISGVWSWQESGERKKGIIRLPKTMPRVTLSYIRRIIINELWTQNTHPDQPRHICFKLNLSEAVHLRLVLAGQINSFGLNLNVQLK